MGNLPLRSPPYSYQKGQECQFSYFGLISDFFALTPVKNIFEISILEHFSHDFIIYSVFQKKSVSCQNVSLNLT